MNSKTIIKHVERLGLEASTVYNETPYFFIFVEIDSKEISILQSITKYLINQNLSLLIYETNKGFHIVSPSLVHLQEWIRITQMCQKIYSNPFYHHDVIRISFKKNDDTDFAWYNSDFNEIHKVSDDFLNMYELKYKKKVNCPNRVKTKLKIVTYEDLEIN